MKTEQEIKQTIKDLYQYYSDIPMSQPYDNTLLALNWILYGEEHPLGELFSNYLENIKSIEEF